VTVREIDGTRIKLGPIEGQACVCSRKVSEFDGTPVVDSKSASTRADG
jgi:tRNA (Thr-GGU) A37 N-methylase